MAKAVAGEAGVPCKYRIIKESIKHTQVCVCLILVVVIVVLFAGQVASFHSLIFSSFNSFLSCTVYSISGSDFIEMFVGVGPSRVGICSRRHGIKP